MSKFFSGDPPSVTDVAQTLVAHGCGVASVSLAFDLVLNDFVEQARDETGARGAAIALVRDGEMVCRATTAPDLVVCLDAASEQD